MCACALALTRFQSRDDLVSAFADHPFVAICRSGGGEGYASCSMGENELGGARDAETDDPARTRKVGAAEGGIGDRRGGF